MLYLSTSGFYLQRRCYFGFSQLNDDHFAAFRISIDLLSRFVKPMHDIRHIRGDSSGNRILCNPCCAIIRLLQTADIYSRGIPSPNDGFPARTVHQNVHCLCGHLYSDRRNHTDAGFPMQHRCCPCITGVGKDMIQIIYFHYCNFMYKL